MVEFRPLIIWFILCGLFSVAVINLIYFVQVDNNTDETILENSKVPLNTYKTEIVGNLTESYNSSKSAENAVSASEISLSGGFPFLDAIKGIWKTIKTSPVIIYEIIAGLGRTFFLSGTETLVVFSAIMAIMIITVIFAVWKLISTGESG